MSPDQATRALQDAAALWSADAVSPQAVVRCACDALIAGLDSPSLRILAGLTRSEADCNVPGVLPAALAELGLEFYSRDSRGGQEAAARALAAQAMSGCLPPRELAAAIHQHFGHSLPLAERLATLDDEYDLGACATMTPQQIDQEVIAEARRLTHQQDDSRPGAITSNRHANPRGTMTVP
ncbi:MAG: hypothetical protein M3Z75_09595 [Actinomycetota bacterium]|nr:hypothetical protein [Actinomycetota bacterium]